MYIIMMDLKKSEHYHTRKEGEVDGGDNLEEYISSQDKIKIMTISC